MQPPLNNVGQSNERYEQEKLLLEITSLKKMMYMPWLSTALTIIAMLIGWNQFNKEQTDAFEKQNRDIAAQLDRDAKTHEHEYQKYFLEKRTADYVLAVQTAAAIAEWLPDHEKSISKFRQLHIGTMQLYEDKDVLLKMSQFLDQILDVEQEQRIGKSEIKLQALRTSVKEITDACKKSLYGGAGLPQPISPEK